MSRVPYVFSAIFVFGAIPAAAVTACGATQGLPLTLLSSVLLIPATAALWECLRNGLRDPWSGRPGWHGVNVDF